MKGWTDDWPYSLEVERGAFNQKGASFVAATMIDCQSAPLDHLMYYDARPNGMNGMFSPSSLEPMKGYYPFYAWSKLPPLDPRRVRCHVTDAVRIYTEVPLARSEDGSYLLRMQPNSFALVEW